MFTVELAGHGVVRDPGFPPYPVFVISVTQPVQSWTVYRRYSSFRSLGEHLGSTVGGLSAIPTCPHMTDDMLMGSDEQLDRARVLLQQWLHQTLLFPGVKESQALRNFLCANANSPPPRLEIQWASTHCPSLDEMQMDELFDRHLDDREDLDDADGEEEVDDDSSDVISGSTFGGRRHITHDSDDIQSHMDGIMGKSSMMNGHRGNNSYRQDDHVHHGVVGGSVSRNGRYSRSGGDAMDQTGRSVEMDSQYTLGAGDYAGYDPATDIPNEEDIASSIPINISFRDPPPIHSYYGNGEGRGDEVDDRYEEANGVGELASQCNDIASPGNDGSGWGGVARSPSSNEACTQGARQQQRTGGAEGGGGGGGEVAGSSMGGGTPALAKRKVGLDSFKIVRVIGKGSFGKVFLVREKTARDIYAMKVLRKDNIIQRNQVEHTKTERNVLGYVKHPFIVGLNMAFQTRDKLFFVLDYCAGGELFFHLGKLGKFTQARSRFYSAEITLALQHVHRLDIVYRDLKPENVLLDGEGHIRLTDFGLSKEGISNTTSGAHSFCGTPEYLAPEILNRQGHGRAVDWWSLGALLYEMLTGLPPFYCRDREKLFEKIRKGHLTYPRYLSENAQDILHGLLTRDPSKRLGSSPGDAEEVKRHPFFAQLDWRRILRREVQPPWEPTVAGSLDTSQFDREFTSMPIFSPEQREHKLGQSVASNDDTFEGFTFVDSSSHLHPSHSPSGLSGFTGRSVGMDASLRSQRLMVDHMDTPDI